MSPQHATWPDQYQNIPSSCDTPLDPHTASVCPAPGWSGCRINGPDAARFLQGLITCDIHALATIQLGACCNLKGRVISTLYVTRHGPDQFDIWLPSDLLPHCLEQWQKTAPFFQLSMNTVTDQLCFIYHPATDSTLSLPPTVYAHADPLAPTRHWCVGQAEAVLAWLDSSHPSLINPTQQNLFDINAGIITLNARTTEQCLPQMLALDKRDALSWSKGCYLGQEVVARTQHRGQIKRQLYRLTQKKTTTLSTGDTLYTADKKAAGLIIQCVLCHEQWHALVVIHTQYVAALQNDDNTTAFTPLSAS